MILPTVYDCVDGSKTLYFEPLNETYHSRNGSVAESNYVFIKQGLHYFLNQSNKNKIVVFEMGFGTGLNALLTLKELVNYPLLNIEYLTVETNPLPFELIHQLQYINAEDNYFEYFKSMHQADFNTRNQIHPQFSINKLNLSITDIDFTGMPLADIVYYDAFAPDRQPELWTKELFEKIFLIMQKGGVLTTYSSKGDVKRNLRAAGFNVFRLPGPPNKRHMLRAIKP